jgi:integrase
MALLRPGLLCDPTMSSGARAIVSALMPAPLSSTATITESPVGNSAGRSVWFVETYPVLTVKVPPSVIALREFMAWLRMAVANWEGSIAAGSQIDGIPPWVRPRHRSDPPFQSIDVDFARNSLSDCLRARASSCWVSSVPRPAGCIGPLARYRPFLITAIFTGMRASELRGLTWSALGFTDKTITGTPARRRMGNVG